MPSTPRWWMPIAAAPQRQLARAVVVVTRQLGDVDAVPHRAPRAVLAVPAVVLVHAGGAPHAVEQRDHGLVVEGAQPQRGAPGAAQVVGEARGLAPGGERVGEVRVALR